MVGKGLEHVATVQAEREAAREAGKYKKLFLTDNGDSARFRFITDAPDLVSGYFHNYPIQQKSGRVFRPNVLCAEEGGYPCNCPLPNPDFNKARSYQGAVWVYVYDLTTFAVQEGENVSTVKKLGQTKLSYVRTINEVRLLMLKTAQMNLLTQLAASSNGTILNREIQLTRNGAKGEKTTDYSFLTLDKNDSPIVLEDTPPDLLQFLVDESERALGGQQQGYDKWLGRDTVADTFVYPNDDGTETDESSIPDF